VIRAKKPFKCNDEYPYRFVSSTPTRAVSMQNPTAKTASVNASQTTITIPIVPRAVGKQRFSGTLSFSVCTDAQCLVEKRQLALDFEVR
jgi:hypothetical protein